MKRLLTLGLLVISMRFILPAQNFVNEYGKIRQEDVDLNSYEKDKSAEAVVIYDIGSSYFEQTSSSFDLMYEHTSRIKIFKEAGIKWATIEIPYYQKGEVYEKIEDLEACTYNYQNGTLLKTILDITNSHDEILNERWKVRKFAMPNVKQGSIVEYHYKVRSQSIFNFRSWEFQSKIPVIYSKYVAKMIPFYEYTYLLQGASKFDYQKSYVDNGIERHFGSLNFHDMIHEYVMKDVPAFKDEEYITSISDHILKIDFQLSKVTQLNGSIEKVLTTWPELIKNLLKDDNFGKYVDKSEKLAAKVFDLKELSIKSSREKFDSIMNYVKTNYSWNKINRKYAYKSPSVLIKDKLGSSAEINLFAVGLLRSCGIQATPIILSTRENGKIKYDYPFDHFFNYVCVLVDIDGKRIITDATDPLLSNDRIPERCINDKGLLIQKDNIEWVSLRCNFPSKEQTTIRTDLIGLTQNRVVETTATEYDAFNKRKEYGKGTDNILKKLVESGYSVVDSTITVKNETNLKMPYSFKYRTVNKQEAVNSKIYVSPFAKEVLSENPLKQTLRTYPIDMLYPTKRTYYAEINIPKGYKVDFLPANDKITNDQFELDYNIVSNESKITATLIYYFRLPIYESDEYSKIKYYFNEIVNKGSEKIVLTRE